jgi:hypothetical protein
MELSRQERQEANRRASQMHLDPLSRVPGFYVGGSDYTGELRRYFLYSRLVDETINKILSEAGVPDGLLIETGLSRWALKGIIDRVHAPMNEYMRGLIDKQERIRNGVNEMDLVWLSFHKYLMQNGFNEENAETYVEKLKSGQLPQISAEALEHQHEYFSKYEDIFEYRAQYPMKIQPTRPHSL